MIIDYILNSRNKISNAIRRKHRINEDYENPLDILRSNGIKIKNVMPHKEYIEVFIFNDVNKINFDNILKNYYFVIDNNENKIFIKYDHKDQYE